MKIQTKYNIGDIVIVSKSVVRIKRIEINVGIFFPRFNHKESLIRYFVETPDCAHWSNISEKLVMRKATIKEWEKAGGEIVKKFK